MLIIEKSKNTDKQRKLIPISNVPKNLTHTNFSGCLILSKKYLLIFQQYFKLIIFKYVYELATVQP